MTVTADRDRHGPLDDVTHFICLIIERSTE